MPPNHEAVGIAGVGTRYIFKLLHHGKPSTELLDRTDSVFARDRFVLDEALVGVLTAVEVALVDDFGLARLGECLLSRWGLLDFGAQR